MIVMFFCFYWYGVNRDLHVLTHSFPTRRSSELWDAGCRRCAAPFQQYWDDDDIGAPHVERDVDKVHRTRIWPCPADTLPGCGVAPSARSEEHTSEIQSLMRISYAVFCLNKKKNRSDCHTLQLNSHISA